MDRNEQIEPTVAGHCVPGSCWPHVSPLMELRSPLLQLMCIALCIQCTYGSMCAVPLRMRYVNGSMLESKTTCNGSVCAVQTCGRCTSLVLAPGVVLILVFA